MNKIFQRGRYEKREVKTYSETFFSNLLSYIVPALIILVSTLILISLYFSIAASFNKKEIGGQNNTVDILDNELQNFYAYPISELKKELYFEKEESGGSLTYFTRKTQLYYRILLHSSSFFNKFVQHHFKNLDQKIFLLSLKETKESLEIINKQCSVNNVADLKSSKALLTTDSSFEPEIYFLNYYLEKFLPSNAVNSISKIQQNKDYYFLGYLVSLSPLSCKIQGIDGIAELPHEKIFEEGPFLYKKYPYLFGVRNTYLYSAQKILPEIKKFRNEKIFVLGRLLLTDENFVKYSYFLNKENSVFITIGALCDYSTLKKHILCLNLLEKILPKDKNSTIISIGDPLFSREPELLYKKIEDFRELFKKINNLSFYSEYALLNFEEDFLILINLRNEDLLNNSLFPPLLNALPSNYPAFSFVKRNYKEYYNAYPVPENNFEKYYEIEEGAILEIYSNISNINLDSDKSISYYTSFAFSHLEMLYRYFF